MQESLAVITSEQWITEISKRKRLSGPAASVIPPGGVRWISTWSRQVTKSCSKLRHTEHLRLCFLEGASGLVIARVCVEDAKPYLLDQSRILTKARQNPKHVTQRPITNCKNMKCLRPQQLLGWACKPDTSDLNRNRNRKSKVRFLGGEFKT